MKRLVQKIIILTFLASMVFPAYAIAGGFTGWHYIMSIQHRECEPNKGIEIKLATAHENPSNCSNNQVLELSCDMPNYKNYLAMILTAYSSGQQIQCWVSGCDAEGQSFIKSVAVASE